MCVRAGGVLACALYLPHAHFVVCNHPLMCAHVSIIVARTRTHRWQYTTARSAEDTNTICRRVRAAGSIGGALEGGGAGKISNSLITPGWVGGVGGGVGLSVS